MTRHIGILACSSEGAALCYRTVCLEAEALMGRHAHPEITLHGTCLAEYTKHLGDPEDWPAVAEIMLRSVERLRRAGADFVICPDNTIHSALPYVLPQSPLPWLHIAEEVAREAAHRSFRKLGLTGTASLVDSNVYPEKLAAAGIDFRRPTPEQRDKIDRIIYDELVRGQQTPAALRYFQEVIDGFKAQGCDAVILGCTEIPLIVNDQVSSLPTLDSTRILARAALRHAMSEDPLKSSG